MVVSVINDGHCYVLSVSYAGIIQNSCLGDPSPSHRGATSGPGPGGGWTMNTLNPGAGGALGQLGAQHGHREQQAQGPYYQRAEVPQGPTYFMKTKARVPLKIPLFPRFPSRLLLWPHMFPMNPHSNEFRPTNNSVQLFGGREFLQDEVMLWLQ